MLVFLISTQLHSFSQGKKSCINNKNNRREGGLCVFQLFPNQMATILWSKQSLVLKRQKKKNEEYMAKISCHKWNCIWTSWKLKLWEIMMMMTNHYKNFRSRVVPNKNHKRIKWKKKVWTHNGTIVIPVHCSLPLEPLWLCRTMP